MDTHWRSQVEQLTTAWIRKPTNGPNQQDQQQKTAVVESQKGNVPQL